MKTINFNFDELTAIKHESNLQAFNTWKKLAIKRGILESAPWEAVLSAFLEWKNECENNAPIEDQKQYIESVNKAITTHREICSKISKN